MTSHFRARAIVVLCAGASCLAAGQAVDTTPPKLTSVSFSTNSIDTTSTPQTVTVTMGITDDLSGTNSVYFQFYSPSRGQYQYGFGSRISGTALNGVWQANLGFPQFTESGAWTADQIILRDTIGNAVTLSTANLAAAGFPTNLNVVSKQDVSPPVLTGMAITPATADVSAGPVPVTVTLSITDDLSGVSFPSANDAFSGGCKCTYWAMTLVSPSGKQDRPLLNIDFTRISGTNLNGVWQANFTLPQYSEPGIWTVQQLRLFDLVGNETYLSSSALATLIASVPLQVKSARADTTAPQLVNLSLYPNYINTSQGSQTVTVTINATDDLSGLDMNQDNASGFPSYIYGVLFSSPSGLRTADAGPSPPLKLVSGTTLNGQWQGTAVFPQFSEPGTWKVEQILLKDAARNKHLYLTADLAALGLPAGLPLVNASLVSEGTISSAGGTVSDATFGAKAQISAAPGVFATTTKVALDVLTSSLAFANPVGYSSAATFYMNVQLTPVPSFPLPAPGVTVVLPLFSPMPAGRGLDLFRVDTGTGMLVPVLDPSGKTVTGNVDAGGVTATFTGVTHLSLLTALIPTSTTVFVNQGGAVNAASFAAAPAPVSPGAIISIFGSNLASATKLSGSLPLPLALSGVSVRINGVLAPVFAVSPTQVNVLFPYEAPVADGTAAIVVSNGTAASNPISVNTSVSAPGLFLFSTGEAAATHADGTPVSAANAATTGEVILIFCTGLGPLNGTLTSGSPAPSNPPITTGRPLVTFSGKPATVQFAGLAPGFAGLIQLNAQVPPGLPPGPASVIITLGLASNSANVAIR